MAWTSGALILFALALLLERRVLRGMSDRSERLRLLRRAWPLLALLAVVGSVGGLVAASELALGRSEPASRLADIERGVPVLISGRLAPSQPLRSEDYPAYVGAAGDGKAHLVVRLADADVAVANDDYEALGWKRVQIGVGEWIRALESGDRVALAGVVFGLRRRGSGQPGTSESAGVTARLVARGEVAELRRALTRRAALAGIAPLVSAVALGWLGWGALRPSPRHL